MASSKKQAAPKGAPKAEAPKAEAPKTEEVKKGGVIEAVKHISLFAHFLSGIAVLVFYYCGNQEEKDKYLNRILVACMSLLFMAIALPPFGLPKPESHDLQNKGFTIPKISQEPMKKKKA